MSIRTINIASTPCCGLIARNCSCDPDETSVPGVEDFQTEYLQLKQGICPDCGNSFEWWLKMFGRRSSNSSYGSLHPGYTRGAGEVVAAGSDSPTDHRVASAPCS